MNLPYFLLQARNENGDLLLEWPAMAVPRKGERIFIQGIYAVVRDEPLYIPPQGIGAVNPMTTVQLILTRAAELPQPTKSKPKRIPGTYAKDPTPRPPRAKAGEGKK